MLRNIPQKVRGVTEPVTQWTETLGTGAFAGAGVVKTVFGVTGSVGQAILEDLPIFAFITGVGHVVDGFAAAIDRSEGGTKGDVFVYRKKQRYIRGVLRTVQMAADLTLAQGGAEALGFFGEVSTLQYLSLPWRFAIHHMAQFLLAAQDMCVLIHGFNITSNKLKPDPDDPKYLQDLTLRKPDVIAKLITHALATAGWILLATHGLTNPAGWLCLAACTLGKVYQHRSRPFDFFKDLSRICSDNPNNAAPTTRHSPHS